MGRAEISVPFSLIRENPCHPWFYEIFSKEQEFKRESIA